VGVNISTTGVGIFSSVVSHTGFYNSITF